MDAEVEYGRRRCNRIRVYARKAWCKSCFLFEECGGCQFNSLGEELLRAQIIQTLATRALLLAAGVLASVITARYLGPEGRGEYFFAVTLAALISQFANLGLHSSNTYYAAKQSEMVPSLLSNSLWVSMILGGLGSILAITVILWQDWFPQAHASTLIIAGLIAPFSLYYMLGSNLLVGMGKISSFNLFEALARIAPLILMLLAGWCSLGVDGFLGATLIAAVGMSIGILVKLSRYVGNDYSWNGSVFRDTMNYGFRAYIAALLAFGISRLNVFWLQHYGSPSDLGYFSIAVQFGDALAVLPTSIGLVLLPKLVRQQEAATMRRTLILVGFSLAIMCGVLAMAAELIIPVLFGEAFRPAIGVLYWYLPSVICLGLISIISQYIAAIGIPVRLLLSWMVGLAIVFISGPFMIFRMGGAGAGLSIFIAYAIVLLMLYKLSRNLHIR